MRLSLVKAGKPLDDDNLRGALKAVRDSVAKTIGVDDADPRVTWEYEQFIQRTLKRERRVRIQIERRPA